MARHRRHISGELVGLADYCLIANILVPCNERKISYGIFIENENRNAKKISY